MPDTPAAPAAGPEAYPAQLGKYRVTGVLGRGAMGVVYKAEDPVIRRPVAIKTIQQHSATYADPQAKAAARFRNEAQAAGRLLHPGIVAVYEYGEQGDVAFIAMEYVEGQTLAHFLQQKIALTDADILSVMVQLLEALEHAHEMGVWHRDIKPSNLIVTRRGRIKVNDFGIARIENSDLTQMSVLIGTPHYMAPEQYLDGPIDRRVDLWASGVLLYQLLTGRLPFIGAPDAVMYQVMHQTPLPPSALAPARPPWYDAIVQKALAKSRDARYASAALFMQDLLGAATAPASPTISEQTVVRAASSVRRIGLPMPEGYGTATGSPASAFGADALAHGTPQPRALSGSQAEPLGFAQPPPSSGSTQAPPGWDAAVLTRIEAELARHVGPVAKVLVARAARQCSDVESLRGRLAVHLANEAERERFIHPEGDPSTRPRASAFGPGFVASGLEPSFAAITGGDTAAAGPASGFGASELPAPPQPPSDALIVQATRLLSERLGPIARVLTRRAAQDCGSGELFVQRVLAHLQDEGERQRVGQALAGLR